MKNEAGKIGERDTCLVQLHLRSLGQLFSSMEPSPLTERDLHDQAAMPVCLLWHEPASADAARDPASTSGSAAGAGSARG